MIGWFKIGRQLREDKYALVHYTGTVDITVALGALKELNYTDFRHWDCRLLTIKY
jgi:hypothetical protein